MVLLEPIVVICNSIGIKFLMDTYPYILDIT